MHLVKKYIAVFLFAFSLFQSMGQTSEYPWAVSGGASLITYRPHPGNPALHENIFDFGYQLAVQKYLNGAFEFRTEFLYAPKVNFPEGIISRRNTSLLDLNYRLSFKFNNGVILRESGFLGPFLSVGLGGSYANNHPDAYVPLGGGFRFRVNHRMAFRLETTRKISLNKDYQNLSHALAFIYNLDQEGGQLKLDPQEIPDIQTIAALIPRDIDQDGLVDAQDECPEVAGPLGTNGCPTKDFSTPDPSLEVIDVAKVPEEPKEVDPVLDSSPFTDEFEVVDKVKSVPPKEAFSTKDEIKIDVVAHTKPEAEESIVEESVPEIIVEEADEVDVEVVKKMPCGQGVDSESINPVFFAYGSDEISGEALSQLDKIADMMKSCTETKLIISGHTDNKGTEADNLVLSIKRAFNVKYYLVNNHQISQYRISSDGLGEDQPLAENKTSSGREKNRRVDFRFIF